MQSPRALRRVPSSVAALAALVAATFLGCEADLEDDCTSGPCGGATVATAAPASSSASGDGGGASGCLFPDTGELPCEVFTILDGRCHRCHQDPPLNGAPFPLLTWNDFQQPYGVTLVWEHAAKAVEPGGIPQMPFLEDPLPEEQLVVLRAWFDTCRAGACAKSEVSGAGGAGGDGSGGRGGGGGATAGSGGAGGI